MAKYDFVDREGLNHLVDKIKELYITKASTEEIKTTLEQLISAEVSRATNRENTIESYAQEIAGNLTDETTRAEEAENSLEGKIDSEKSTREAEDFDIRSAATLLTNRVSDLETGKVSDVTVNGLSVVEDNIAKIRVGAFTDTSIKVYDHFSDFPPVGEDNKLYIDNETRIIYQYDGSEYKEAGKPNIVLVNELPEVGDPQVFYIMNNVIYMWIWDGDPDHDKWQEISGQDKELRTEFEELKDDYEVHDHDDRYPFKDDVYTKDEVYSKDKVYTKNETYSQEEVDDIIEHIVIPETALQDHIENPNPHPAFEERIEGFIESALEDKADTSTLNEHLLNRENPHRVTKNQIGLENVDNTSDASKPISVATQLELDKKVNTSEIANNLETLVASVPLSALQGAALKGLIQDTEDKILSIGNALHFKGTVSSIEELNALTGMVQGDCWQIVEPEPEPDPEEDDSSDETEEEVESHNGEMYAWTGSEWKQVLASVSDISAYAASLAEVYEIINRY